mmetsp:Transcript_79052/g.243958  ORF Transcript_79052/g.243958 Transcript_79052/m.243958 type:complete len:243 (-) Transcript_79052:6-734(-)
MLMQKTSLLCCGMLASHAGEFGCPTKRPSSESTMASRDALKPSCGTAWSGFPSSSSVHQCSTMISFARKSCEKSPSCSTVRAFRKILSSTVCSAASSRASPASSGDSSFSSNFPSSSACSAMLTSSLVARRIPEKSSHFSRTSPATSFLAATSSSKNVCTLSLTRLGSTRELPSSMGSRKLACQSSVITPFTKSCTASPTSSANSCCCRTPCRWTAFTRPSSCRGSDSRRPSRSTEPRATCM